VTFPTWKRSGWTRVHVANVSGSQGFTGSNPVSSAILIAFIIAQVLDGALTGWGVRQFGVDIEFNPLIRAGLVAYGLWSLVVVKVVAIAMGWFIHYHKRHKWLLFATIVYFVFAVGPWLLLWLN
jgi:hypothetical protein